MNLVIYYKSQKTSHLLLRNRPKKKKAYIKRTHVVYRFTYNRENWESLPSTYIGMTTMALSRCLSYHLSSGAPYNHMKKEHNSKLTRETLHKT